MKWMFLHFQEVARLTKRLSLNVISMLATPVKRKKQLRSRKKGKCRSCVNFLVSQPRVGILYKRLFCKLPIFITFMLFHKFANAAQKMYERWWQEAWNLFFYQLQTFERCARFLHKGRETKRWNSISPEMMSHEEKHGSVYIRHQPEYHSETFNLFLMKGVASKVQYMPAFRGRLAHQWSYQYQLVEKLGCLIN